MRLFVIGLIVGLSFVSVAPDASAGPACSPGLPFGLIDYGTCTASCFTNGQCLPDPLRPRP